LRAAELSEPSLPPNVDPVAPVPNRPASRRPWCRLHLSTWLVMLSVTMIVALVEVPGEYFANDTDRVGLPVFNHGWPRIYLKRHWAYPTPVQYFLTNVAEDDQKAPWLVPYQWTFYENFGESRLSLPNLILDLMVALLIVAIAGALFEWRRRKRSRLIQFTLRELLLLTLLTAGVFSWWRTEHNRRSIEQELVNQHGLDRFVKNNQYMGPAVLRKLLGLGCLDDWYRYDTFLMFEPKSDDVKRCFPLVKNFHSLQSVTVHRAINVGDEQIADISDLANLEELYLCDAKLTDEGAEMISCLRNLKKLTVANSQITDASIPALCRLAELKSLDVSGTQITYDGCQQLKSQLPRCIVIRVGLDTLLDDAGKAIRRATKKQP
jgi:hypothetical protein